MQCNALHCNAMRCDAPLPSCSECQLKHRHALAQNWLMIVASPCVASLTSHAVLRAERAIYNQSCSKMRNISLTQPYSLFCKQFDGAHRQQGDLCCAVQRKSPQLLLFRSPMQGSSPSGMLAMRCNAMQCDAMHRITCSASLMQQMSVEATTMHRTGLADDRSLTLRSKPYMPCSAPRRTRNILSMQCTAMHAMLLLPHAAHVNLDRYRASK
jgi:hypothetical protein